MSSHSKMVGIPAQEECDGEEPAADIKGEEAAEAERDADEENEDPLAGLTCPSFCAVLSFLVTPCNPIHVMLRILHTECIAKPLLDAPGMNPYERAREERIASNRARLAALDLPGMASNFVAQHLSKPKKPSKPRGLATKRQKKVMRQCMPFMLLACISCLPLSQALFVSFCGASSTTLISHGADVVRDTRYHIVMSRQMDTQIAASPYC